MSHVERPTPKQPVNIGFETWMAVLVGWLAIDCGNTIARLPDPAIVWCQHIVLASLPNQAGLGHFNVNARSGGIC